jgi:uncharacterized protein (DUF1800 family)
MTIDFGKRWWHAVGTCLLLALAAGEAPAQSSQYALDYVQKAYVAYYGRPADPGGQAYWAGRLDAAGGALDAIIDAFGNSVEFNQRYGGLNPAALVTKVYQQALNRDPDPAGLAYYVGELQAGRRTLQSITLDVLNGATTPPDSTVVANKLTVAAYYTAKVAAGCPYGTEQDGVATLAVVTANAALVWSARAAIDSRCRSNPNAVLGTAVEFYSAKLRRYFLTPYAEEAALLDVPTADGWARTGGRFSVYPDPGAGLVPVCRFTGTPGIGVASTLYTADAAECGQLKGTPAWTYEGIAFHAKAPTSGQCGDHSPVYRSYSATYANHRLTVDLTAHVRMPSRRGDGTEGTVMCAPVSDAEVEADVVRFLEQATLGPTEALVQEVKTKGIEKWLDEQIALNVTRYSQWPLYMQPADPLACIDDATPPVTPEKFCITNKVSPWPVGWEFFRQAKPAPDQLRLRMAHVWHQIFVVSAGNATYGYADYQQRLRDNAFGTFEHLLTTYTLTPLLGQFQNWLYNVPEQNGVKPNENFARELMQLFTTGVNQLNDDGVPQLDAGGQLVPVYSQADIETLARVLTGFGFPPWPGESPQWFWKPFYLGDSIVFENFHDKNPKSALGGRLQLAAGGAALDELHKLLKVLVDHPNTPPFICKQLIQKTVTSSPTPEYVARVVAAFKNNGKGVRGDLAAVTRAILLDPEARGSRKIDPEYGRMREPVLFWTAMIRGLDVSTDGLVPYQEAARGGQQLFFPESVFSYYPADFTLAGGSIPAPEFGIYGSSEFMNRLDSVTLLLYIADLPYAQGRFGPQPYVPSAIGTHSPALNSYVAEAGNAEALVSLVDRNWLHGTMRPAVRASLLNAVGKLPAFDPLARARLALKVVLSSVDYHVQK